MSETINNPCHVCLNVFRLLTKGTAKEKPPIPQSCPLKKQSEMENQALPPVSAFPVPPVPVNSFQLESDFRKLKCYPDQLYTYLKVR